MPEVEVNGTRLFYQQSGEGPDVVLVHAVTSNQAVWVFTGLADAIAADGFRVTTYDLRGHGASERPPTGYTSAAMAEDFRRLHAALGLEPAFLVGHSFGGVVGLHAALLSLRSASRGVILSDSFFPGSATRRAELREAERLGRSAGDVPKGRHRTRRDGGLHPALPHRGALTPEQLKTLDDIVGAVGRGWLRQLPQLAETTCGDEVLAEAGLTAERIAAVQPPVVALYDEFSPFLATVRWLEQHLTLCVAEIIPAAKHLAVVENTAAFTDAVRRHLTRLARVGRPESADG